MNNMTVMITSRKIYIERRRRRVLKKGCEMTYIYLVMLTNPAFKNPDPINTYIRFE